MSYSVDGIVVTPIGMDGETMTARGTGGDLDYEWTRDGATYRAHVEDPATGPDGPVTVTDRDGKERGRFGSLEAAVRQLSA